jgi:hypothetical protein
LADAGKIMIMPKGAYDAGTSYEVLDLVTHNDRVWVAKRNVTGVEPTEENSADWFMMVDDNVSKLGGKSASDFMQHVNGYGFEIHGDSSDLNTWITTGTYCASPNCLNIPSDTDGWGNLLVFGGISNRVTQLFLPWNNSSYLYFRTLEESVWTPWIKIATTADLANYLPLNGSVPMSGRLNIDTNGAIPLGIKNTGGDANVMEFNGKSGALGYLGFNAVDSPVFMKATGGFLPLLHTGNKPTGTYTGNGSATSRTISTGGIGYAVVIWATTSVGNSSIFVNVGGYGHRAGTAFTYSSAIVSMNDGNIILATDDTNLNESGTTYHYQVL